MRTQLAGKTARMRASFPAVFSLPVWGQAKKTIYMITDAEGVAGVCRQDQTDPKDAEIGNCSPARSARRLKDSSRAAPMR